MYSLIVGTVVFCSFPSLPVFAFLLFFASTCMLLYGSPEPPHKEKKYIKVEATT